MHKRFAARTASAAVAESPPWVSERLWIIAAVGQQQSINAALLSAPSTGRSANIKAVIAGTTASLKNAET